MLERVYSCTVALLCIAPSPSYSLSSFGGFGPIRLIDMLNLSLHLLSCYIFHALASTLHTDAEMETGAAWVTH